MNNRMKKLLAAILIVILPLNALPASASEITLVHPDHLGSPVAYTDIDGNVIGREYYTPYGESLNPPTTDDTVSYTGQVRDGDTGLLYMQARYYDPEIGRFLSVDPATFSPDQPQQFNRYWYANGNPYLYMDPDGRASFAAFKATFAFVAADAAVPDPSDAVAPAKAAAYTSALIGTAIGGAIHLGITAVMNESGESTENGNASGEGGDEGGVIEIDDPKPPFTGEPGSTVRGKKQTRRYGSDGYPEVDVEGNHPGDGFSEEGEHAHDWGRPNDGGPPTHEDKGDPRPLTAEDPPSPRGFD